LTLGAQSLSQACEKRTPTPEASPGPQDFSVAPAETSLWREGDVGESLFLHARVLDTCGKGIKGARIKMLHANQDGEHEAHRWRAHLTSVG